MILVDTSVWIDFFRGKEDVVKKLTSLLDDRQVGLAAPVYLELLNGAKKKDYKALKRVFSALPSFFPGDDEWRTISSWIELSKNKGLQFSIPDLLIASISRKHQSEIWTFDKDFQKMKKLGFVELF